MLNEVNVNLINHTVLWQTAHTVSVFSQKQGTTQIIRCFLQFDSSWIPLQLTYTFLSLENLYEGISRGLILHLSNHPCVDFFYSLWKQKRQNIVDS